MQMRTFDHVDNWVFDLDNTLYPASCRLFDQIDRRMTAYVADYLDIGHEEAYALQKSYFRDFGTTMNGMMVNHRMDPEDYLQYVHDIDHSPVKPAPELAAALAALPGRRLIFTNASRHHASMVLNRLGIEDLFEDVFDIRSSGFVPKPSRETYAMMINATGIDPHRSAMFEDIARNLVVPCELGMTTVLVRGPGAHADAGAFDLGTGQEPHVHYTTADLAKFLNGAR